MMAVAAVSSESPEEKTLAIWKAHSESLALIKFLHENPDVIDEVTGKVAAAHKLTQAEKDERQAAIDDVAQAKSNLDFLQSQKSALEAECPGIIKRAQKEAQKITDDADAYKKAAEKAAKKRSDDLDEIKTAHDAREADVSKREAAMKDLDKNLKDFEKAKKDFAAEKQAWEDDFADRNSKLDARTRKAIKG